MCGQAAWRDTGRRRRGQNLCCQVRLSSSRDISNTGKGNISLQDKKMINCNKVLFQWKEESSKTKQKYFLLLCFDLQYFSPETEIVLNISYNKHKAYQLLQVINQIYWPMTEYWSLLLANESSVLVSRGCYQSLVPLPTIVHLSLVIT